MNAPSPAPIATPTTSTPSAPAAWLGTADAIISLLAILLAGFVAAHVSRVNDQWLHFAAGRDLLSGKYSLGSDPYSYTAADRTWVNHNWLYDLASYELYSLDGTGQILVAAKAALFALAFAVVLGIRRAGSTAWPWWLFAVIAILAAAPHATLRPIVISGLLVAVFLYMLFRRPWNAGSWRNPLICAGLCALWANLDVWFLLGPVMVGLVLLAEVLQKKFFKQDEAAGDCPATADLSRTLILCLLATLLSPHHVRVWELPFELGLGMPAALANDPQMVNLRMSPLAKDYWKSASYGGNINGYAAAVLFLAGGGLLALGMARVRLAYLALWVLFALLAFVYYRLILFFALAAVPLAAIPLAEIAIRFAANNPTRLPQTLSSVSRLIGVPALLILLVCAWPGWLHPKPNDPANVNRVALGVEADPGFARTARLLNNWRESGKLPESIHGTPLSIELANHIAWFAPQERVAINGRFQHHRAELPAFLAARAAFADQEARTAFPSFAGLGAEYAILSSQSNAAAMNVLQILQLTNGPGSFALWHLDGRVAVLANRKGTSGVALRFDPVRLAFAADQPPLPEPVVIPPPPRTRDSFDDFVQSPKPMPVETLDALAYQTYASLMWSHAINVHQDGFYVTSAALAGPGLPRALNYSMILPPTPDETIAANLLAQRAARQAMALNPDHPLAYFALAHCVETREYSMPGFSKDELQIQQATAFRRYLDRIPLPAEATSFEALSGARAAEALAIYYEQKQNQMLDFARAAWLLMVEYQKRRLLFEEKDADQLKRQNEQLDKFLAKKNANYSERLQSFANVATASTPQRLQAALGNQLVGEAIKIVQACDLEKEFGPNAMTVAIDAIYWRLRAGMLEDAIAAIGVLQPKLKSGAADPELMQKFTGLCEEAQRLAGDYSAFDKSMDDFPRPHSAMTPQQKETVRLATRSPADWQILQGNLIIEHGALGGMPVILRKAYDAETIAIWRSNANAALRRSLIPLLDGRMTEAKERFEKSLAIDGIPLPPFLGERIVAERYLKLIENAKR